MLPSNSSVEKRGLSQFLVPRLISMKSATVVINLRYSSVYVVFIIVD